MYHTIKYFYRYQTNKNKHKIMYTTLTQENWEETVIKSDKVTLVDIWAPWCGPCRILGPTIEKIANEYPEYNICKINADDNFEIINSLGVRNIPTCFIYKNGEIVDKFVGVLREADILYKLSNI